MKLLIADDHAPTRLLIREFVAPLAREIVECSDGAEAVAAYPGFHPDFVIMDLMMPRLDGIAATILLCALDPRAAVLLVSQFDSREARDTARRAGVRHYFVKDDLAALRRYLTASRPPGSA